MPPPNVVTNRYRDMLNKAKFRTEASMLLNAVNVSTKTVQPVIVVEEYRGTHDATNQAEHAGGSLAEARLGMPSYPRLYTFEPGELLSRAAQAVQIFGSSEQNCAQMAQ